MNRTTVTYFTEELWHLCELRKQKTCQQRGESPAEECRTWKQVVAPKLFFRESVFINERVYCFHTVSIWNKIKKFWEELIAYFPLIRDGSHRKRRVQQSFYWCVCVCVCVCVHYLPLSPFYRAIPCNRPWRPIGLWDVEAPTFSRQSANIYSWGQPYAPAALYPQKDSWYSFLLRGWVDLRAIVRLEELGQLKNPITSLGIYFSLLSQLYRTRTIVVKYELGRT
jgi:hypothetical protein